MIMFWLKLWYVSIFREIRIWCGRFFAVSERKRVQEHVLTHFTQIELKDHGLGWLLLKHRFFKLLMTWICDTWITKLFFHSLYKMFTTHISFVIFLFLSLIFFVFLQEKLYGKPLTVADREMVEEKADDMLLEAREFDVAFLVVGDPFG